MASKFNNKILLIVLIVLTGLFFLARTIKQKRSSGNLKTDIVRIDSSLVNSILLYPSAEKGAEIMFSRSGFNWQVTKGDITADADKSNIDNLFAELLVLRPESIVTRNKEKWANYGVTDSLGTRVIMKEGKKPVLDLVVGRFDYQPSPSGYSGTGGNYGTGRTYIRLFDETDVYVVKGFLAMSFNQVFKNWRDQTFLNFDINNINLLTFDYPADSGFVAMKSDTVWIVEGIIADSTSMASYLNAISRKSNSVFTDSFTPVIGADYQLTINGVNMAPIIIKAYRKGENEYIMNSSQNPDSYFTSPRSVLFGTIFKSRSDLTGSQDN
jgi:hypothetical protein